MSNAASLSLPTSPALAGLSESDLDILRRMLRSVTVTKGDAVYRAGEPLNTLYIVQSGQINIVLKCQTGQGDDTVVRTAGPGDLLGDLPSSGDASRAVTSAQALEDSTLLALSREAIEGYLHGQIDAVLRLTRTLEAGLSLSAPEETAAPVDNNVQRLANVLLFLAERDGRIDSGLVTSALRVKDVAMSIGADEEWVSGVLHDWSCQGIIGLTGGRRFLLHDVDALKALAKRED
ncbi:MAG TPA: Crp/Fnr family transcriptional regulator [Aggregatilinea sp.]|uniref:Crp/Fnr family transcriptional regulator n=1 Tax=Aggregatilinea sp. TaxID=2806333 RepID=UPI002C9DC310|nr:Crp/Fnr family transcriptional regulator [Aggregatilinea sp.]HML23583.1 Crp/Fnr family transcriptional regulator [Aggregatilinea sp.]